jgi:hypothetical protein
VRLFCMLLCRGYIKVLLNIHSQHLISTIIIINRMRIANRFPCRLQPIHDQLFAGWLAGVNMAATDHVLPPTNQQSAPQLAKLLLINGSAITQTVEGSRLNRQEVGWKKMCFIGLLVVCRQITCPFILQHTPLDAPLSC